MSGLDGIRKAGGAVWRAIRSMASGLAAPIIMVKVNSKVAKMAIDTSDIEALGDKALRRFVASEWERAKALDEKLQKLTAALSVSVTVGGLVGSTLLQNLVPSPWRMASAILFLAAAILMIIGVVIGFNGLRPKPRYGYGAGFLRIMAQGGDAARQELVAAARSFQRDNQIRSNEAVAATASIRNSILIFAIAIACGVIAAATGKPPEREVQPSTEVVVPEATSNAQPAASPDTLDNLASDCAQVIEAEPAP